MSPNLSRRGSGVLNESDKEACHVERPIGSVPIARNDVSYSRGGKERGQMTKRAIVLRLQDQRVHLTRSPV